VGEYFLTGIRQQRTVSEDSEIVLSV